MNFDLKKPCADCPFRRDIRGYLHPDRAREIAEAMLTDNTFSCHKTNSSDDEGDVIETSESQHCAGAAIFLEKQGRPNQWMRIAERIGFYDRTKLDMEAPVFDSVDEFVNAQPKRE